MSTPAVDAQKRYVRVTGTRRDKYVLFDFAIGAPDLAVELILPFEQFHDFCRHNGVVELAPDEGARIDLERLKWRFGMIGEAG